MIAVAYNQRQAPISGMFFSTRYPTTVPVIAPKAWKPKAPSTRRPRIDSTGVPSAHSATPMTNMQWRIWTLAAAGKFFEGLVVFMTGVALPLIAEEFKITPAQH